MKLSPLGTSATVWPMHQPRMMDDEECGAVGGRGNRSIRGNPALVPLCLAQIPHYLT
jgi:hypothetical protein